MIGRTGDVRVHPCEPEMGRYVVDGERLSEDDMATQREAQFLAAALHTQALRASRSSAPPGTCRNCSAACLPTAVYCDAECRSDHEHRVRSLALLGGRR